jgi:predicted acylesterase/phospholipase RssA
MGSWQDLYLAIKNYNDMRALITSGGGAKGAFSVGVLDYLRKERNIDHFDLISGTSTGALIASLASVGKIQQLVDVYLSTTNSDILIPQNVVDSITNSKPFVYDTYPLMKQIEENIDDNTFNDIMNSNTILCLNAVNLQSGRVTVFTTKDIIPGTLYDAKKINTRDELTQALLASSNQAVFMNPIRVGNDDYVDGGNREVIPTRVVYNNLAKDEEHEIYILSNNPNELVTFPNKKFESILDVLMRAIMMFVQEVRENDLEVMARFKTICTKNVKIFYIHPTGELDKKYPTGLRFDRGLMHQWMLEGKAIAAETIETTPDGNFPEFHHSNRPIV